MMRALWTVQKPSDIINEGSKLIGTPPGRLGHAGLEALAVVLMKQ